MTVITCPNPLLRTYNTGSSETSIRLQKIIKSTVNDLCQAISWSRACEPLEALHVTYSECADNDWDGYGLRHMMRQSGF